MTIETLAARYGLFAIFLGSGIEGEMVVVTGGLLAHQQIVSVWGAAAAAVAGSFTADQFFFIAGRHFRQRSLLRAIAAKPAFAKALAALDRHPIGFTFAFRFIYGLRTVSPIAIGMSHIPISTFVILNAIAATIWGILFTGVGYAFGHGLENVLGHFRSLRHLFLAAGLIAAISYVVFASGRWLLRRNG